MIQNNQLNKINALWMIKADADECGYCKYLESHITAVYYESYPDDNKIIIENYSAGWNVEKFIMAVDRTGSERYYHLPQYEGSLQTFDMNGELAWLLCRDGVKDSETYNHAWVYEYNMATQEYISVKSLNTTIDGRLREFNTVVVEEEILLVDAQEKLWITTKDGNNTEYEEIELFPERFASDEGRLYMPTFTSQGDDQFWIMRLGGTVRGAYGKSSSYPSKIIKGQLSTGKGIAYIEIDFNEELSGYSPDGYLKTMTYEDGKMYLLYDSGFVVELGSINEEMTTTDEATYPLSWIVPMMVVITYKRRK